MASWFLPEIFLTSWCRTVQFSSDWFGKGLVYLLRICSDGWTYLKSTDTMASLPSIFLRCTIFLAKLFLTNTLWGKGEFWKVPPRAIYGPMMSTSLPCTRCSLLYKDVQKKRIEWRVLTKLQSFVWQLDLVDSTRTSVAAHKSMRHPHTRFPCIHHVPNEHKCCSQNEENDGFATINNIIWTTI